MNSIDGKCKERKKDDFDVATHVNYGVASFLSSSKSLCNLEMALRELEGSQRLLSTCEREHLEHAHASP
jgi:hypothetical protein